MKLSSSTRRRALFAALLATFAVLVTLVPVPSSAGPTGSCTYYSDASKTTVVGKRGYDCCNNYISTGVTSPYSTCGGCFICYPPPID